MYNIFRNSISIPSSIKIYILHLRDISYRKHEQICRDQPAENIVQPGKNSATRVMLYGVPQAFTRSNNFYIQSIDGRKNFGKITCIFRAIDAQNFRARNIFLRICGIKLAKKWGSCKWKERKREIIEDRFPYEMETPITPSYRKQSFHFVAGQTSKTDVYIMLLLVTRKHVQSENILFSQW